MPDPNENARHAQQPSGAPAPAHRRSDDVIEHHSARSRRGRERPRIGLNLTAMIDVTFLLLVYFMVATNFRLGEEVYRLDLPRSMQSSGEVDPFELPDQPLIIEVATTGPGLLRYEIRIDGPYDDPDSFEALYVFLRDTRIDESGDAPRPMFAPDHPVIIRPARTAIWEHAVAAFNAAARARYTNVKFAEPDE